MSAEPIAQRLWACDPCGTATCSCCFCGIATRNATSSLERLPQAQRSKRPAALKAERIVHSQGELGEAEVLRLVDVVEEVVHARPRHRRPAVRETPGEPRLQARGEGEEVLPLQLGVVVERARQVEERHPRPQRK